MTKATETKSHPARLYVKGTFLGFKRGRRNTYNHTTLIKIDGVEDTKASEFYYGKKIAYIYKAKVEKAGSKFRCVWGKVMRPHGANGVVRAKFATNLTVSDTYLTNYILTKHC
jgi:large subunit ribosomal protein L35Ae